MFLKLLIYIAFNYEGLDKFTIKYVITKHDNITIRIIV